jgi:ubiquinone/menaquinone biosynthesis C-methylase UbiE
MTAAVTSPVPAQRIWLRHQAPDDHKLRLVREHAVGRRVLDVGCAQGWYGAAAHSAGFDVVWADLTCDVLPELRSAFVSASLMDLPVRDLEFDTTIALDVIEHVQDDEQALRELARVTGRRLILSVPNADDDVLHRYNLTYKHHIDRTHQREYRAVDLVDKLTRAGFVHVRVEQSGMVRPELLAEFVPSPARNFVRRALRLLLRLRLLRTDRLYADLVVVADKPSG